MMRRRETRETSRVADEVLLTGHDGQVFSVAQVIDRCRGGDSTTDVDCSRALLLDQQFSVADYVAVRDVPAPTRRDAPSASFFVFAAVLGLGAGAVGGLIYGTFSRRVIILGPQLKQISALVLMVPSDFSGPCELRP